MKEVENIIQELEVPLKTFRIFAIEKAIRIGRSVDLLEALQRTLENETDLECRMLLEHAIGIIEDRLGQSKKAETVCDEKEIFSRFNQLEPSQQLQFIKATSTAFFVKENPEEKIGKIVESARHPVVTAELIRKCMGSWPASMQNFLESNLFADSSSLQLACLEAIIQSYPEILQKNFEKLVLAPDPLIRALAIRGLARRLPETAAEFLQDCLRKGDYHGKLAALRVCSVMPFELIKSSLFEILFSEQDPKLTKIAAAIIISNPDKETPFRLCEQIARTHGSLQKFLQDLLKKALEIIKISEICDNFQQFLVSVRQYNEKVKIRYFVLNCATLYEEANDERKKQIALAFRQKLENPKVRSVVEQIEKDNAELLKGLNKAATPEPLIETTAKVKDTAVSSQIPEPEETQGENLSLTRAEAEPCDIVEAFKSNDSSILSSAFRTATENNDDRWLAKAKALIKSESEELAASAFDYLAKLDSESFLLLLRGHINSKSILVRTTLLRNVCRISPEMARELLSAMLNDPSEHTRKKALGAIIHFDFSSVREILSEYLRKESKTELINSCLTFYLANPLIESVNDLKQLETRSEYEKIFRETREKLVNTLEELNISNAEEIHQLLTEKTQKDESSQNAALKEEKEKLKKIKARVDWGGISRKISDIGSTLASLKKVLAAAALITAFFWFLTSETPDTISTRKAVVTTPVAGQVQDFKLVTQMINDSDGALIGITSDNKKVKALPRPGKLFRLIPGDRINLRGLPFKAAPDGTLIVKTISIKKTN
ncbi:MAG: hypothetical protein PWR01_2273 [Clostridiales bacterium]|nr:hypothetical protein [Clostridiales bacterium]MDN5281200.1 hypothetical protein [Candidatus Ozemobacter sp.]